MNITNFLIAHNKVVNVYEEKVEFAPFCYNVFKHLHFTKLFGDYIEDLQAIWINKINEYS